MALDKTGASVATVMRTWLTIEGKLNVGRDRVRLVVVAADDWRASWVARMRNSIDMACQGSLMKIVEFLI
jgi:hypothetical protein